mgnify:CR=1 FL=1
MIPMSYLTATLLLLLVFDPIGNIVPFMAALKPVAPARQRRVIVREMLVALAIMIVFLLCGKLLLNVLRIDEPSLSIAGGVVLFLIALRMIFSSPEGVFGSQEQGEPLIVPLAVPLIAGPSAIAMVILLMTREPQRWLTWLAAVASAWLIASLILAHSGAIARLLGARLLTACERLTGMLLTAMAVQMFMTGLRAFLNA